MCNVKNIDHIELNFNFHEKVHYAYLVCVCVFFFFFALFVILMQLFNFFWPFVKDCKDINI